MKRFIVIDGLDGSGKDTQANLIYKKYKNEGSILLRSHPSKDNKYGIKSKEALLKSGKINHLKATVYYGLDVIRSIYKYYGKSDTVIFTRYTLAVAYLPNIINLAIYKIVSILLPSSEYMFFLNVSPEESLARLDNRGEKKEMFENHEELIKAKNKALKVVGEWNIISADNSIDEVYLEISKILDNLDKNL